MQVNSVCGVASVPWFSFLTYMPLRSVSMKNPPRMNAYVKRTCLVQVAICLQGNDKEFIRKASMIVANDGWWGGGGWREVKEEREGGRAWEEKRNFLFCGNQVFRWNGLFDLTLQQTRRLQGPRSGSRYIICGRGRQRSLSTLPVLRHYP